MLSICIPVFNFDVRPFLTELHTMAEASDIPVEVVCLDDGSDADWMSVYNELIALPLVQWHRSERNLGRSAVRNELVRLAQYDNIIFLDCDGRCVSDAFIRNYLAVIQDYDIVYGGRVYEALVSADAFHFHWLYGSRREAQPLSVRIREPYRSFMTNNFMVRKAVFDQIRMDEAIRGYGHEDTLFALRALEGGFRLRHIDNPVIHIGLETADVFLDKSLQGLKNLALLMRATNVVRVSRLAAYRQHFSMRIIAPLVYYLMRALDGVVRSNFRGANPQLWLFDLWKLGHLHGAIIESEAEQRIV